MIRQGRTAPVPKKGEGYFALHPYKQRLQKRFMQHPDTKVIRPYSFSVNGGPWLPWVPRMRARTVARMVREGRIDALPDEMPKPRDDGRPL